MVLIYFCVYHEDPFCISIRKIPILCVFRYYLFADHKCHGYDYDWIFNLLQNILWVNKFLFIICYAYELLSPLAYYGFIPGHISLILDKPCLKLTKRNLAYIN